MNHQISYEVVDAMVGSARQMEITTDRHGLTIHLDTTEQDIIVDLDKGHLRVFLTNEHGDVESGPLASIPIGVKP